MLEHMAMHTILPCSSYVWSVVVSCMYSDRYSAWLMSICFCRIMLCVNKDFSATLTIYIFVALCMGVSMAPPIL